MTNANAVSTPQLTSFMLIYSSSWHVSSLGFNKAFSENGSSLTEGPAGKGSEDTEPKERMEGQEFAEHLLRHFITSTRASSARKGLVLRLVSGSPSIILGSLFPVTVVAQSMLSTHWQSHPYTGSSDPYSRSSGALVALPVYPLWKFCLGPLHTGLPVFPLIWIKHSFVLHLWYWTPCLHPDTALLMTSVG